MTKRKASRKKRLARWEQVEKTVLDAAKPKYQSIVDLLIQAYPSSLMEGLFSKKSPLLKTFNRKP